VTTPFVENATKFPGGCQAHTKAERLKAATPDWRFEVTKIGQRWYIEVFDEKDKFQGYY
jgi:hypothetical protein